MTVPIGIVGLGVYLPPEIRRNDAWPPELTRQWKTCSRPTDVEAGPVVAELRSGQHRVLQELARYTDPFAGITERHVLPKDMSPSEMEMRAAADALASAGIPARDLRLIVTASVVPDHLITNNACRLHHLLKAPRECPAIAIDAACNAFLLSLSLAIPFLVHSGGYALLVQSSAISRILDYGRPASTYFGDAATAAVVGPVAKGLGLVAPIAHCTDGELHGAAAAGSPGRDWYSAAPMRLYAPQRTAAMRMVTESLETMQTVSLRVMDSADRSATDVSFFNSHQGFPWMHAAMLELLGVTRSLTVETFSTTGNCAGATLPLGLAMAARRQMLSTGDLVLLTGLGVGMTASAALLRWGR